MGSNASIPLTGCPPHTPEYSPRRGSIGERSVGRLVDLVNLLARCGPGIEPLAQRCNLALARGERVSGALPDGRDARLAASKELSKRARGAVEVGCEFSGGHHDDQFPSVDWMMMQSYRGGHARSRQSANFFQKLFLGAPP